MLSLVRTSLVLVLFLLGLLLSAAVPPEEWLLSRSKWIEGVNNEQSLDVQRFDEKNKELSPNVQRFDKESVNAEQSEQSPNVQRFDEEIVNNEPDPDVQLFDEGYVSTEHSPDEKRFDEESYSSSNKVPAEVDQIADAFADGPYSEKSLPEILRRQFPHRPQCRFGGCGK